MEQQRKERRLMPKHVRTIYILDWVTFALLIVGLAGVLVPTLIVPQPIGAGRLGGGIAGVSVVGAFILLTVVAIAGVLSRKPWGRIFHTAYSILLLFGFPIYTIIQGFVLYYLFADPEVVAYFKGERPGPPPEERKAA